MASLNEALKSPNLHGMIPEPSRSNAKTSKSSYLTSQSASSTSSSRSSTSTSFSTVSASIPSSTAPSKFVDVKENTTSDVNDDGCTDSGCRCFILINAIILFLLGFAMFVVWLRMAVKTDGPRPFFGMDVDPTLPVYSNFWFLSVNWIYPIISSIGLGLSTYKCRERLVRMYYILQPWLMLLPLSYLLFFTTFLGSLSTTDVLQQKHLDNFRRERDTKRWDDIQNNFKCCGVDNHGWTNWVAAGVLLPDNKQVPSSCCESKNQTDPQGCPYHATDNNTRKSGCSKPLFVYYEKVAWYPLVANVLVLLLTTFSIWSATEYSIFLQRQSNPDYDLSFQIFCTECWKPYKSVFTRHPKSVPKGVDLEAQRKRRYLVDPNLDLPDDLTFPKDPINSKPENPPQLPEYEEIL